MLQGRRLRTLRGRQVAVVSCGEAMQAEDCPGRASARATMSPTKAFVILASVAAIIAGLLFLLQDDAPTPTPRTAAEPNFTLTDAEAVARFRSLNGRALRALRTRDPTLLPRVFYPGSPILKRAQEEVHGLLRNRVSDRSRLQILEVQVVENAQDEVRIVEVSRLFPCFRTESGRDVTRGPAAIWRRVEWTLRRAGSEWLLADSVLRQDRVLREGGSCV